MTKEQMNDLCMWLHAGSYTEEAEGVERLFHDLKEAQELIRVLYNRLGGSPDEDMQLWMKTKEYCLKKKLVEYEK